MSYRKAGKLPGEIFVPEEIEGAAKKHPCKDCLDCQWCSDTRCSACLRHRSCLEGGRSKCKKRECRQPGRHKGS